MRGTRAGHDAGAAAQGRAQPTRVPAHQRRARPLHAERHDHNHPGRGPPRTLGQSGLLQSRSHEVPGGPLVHGSLAFGLTIVFVALAPAPASVASAQSRSAQLLAAARSHIATRQWDSAGVKLSDALQSAPYVMDSAWVHIWRGVLEYQRGEPELARLSFRRAFALHPDPGVRDLDTIATELATLFAAEF